MIDALEKIANFKTFLTPTLIYNEGWLLRLCLNWFSNNSESKLDTQEEISNFASYLKEIPLGTQNHF